MSDQPDIIALHDQVVEEIKQKARVVAAHYNQLRADGVELYEALQLTLDVQRRLIFGPVLSGDLADRVDEEDS